MSYPLTVISEIIGARMVGSPSGSIDSLLTDSRSLSSVSRTLFFALRTRVASGTDYIGELYHKGVHAFVVDERYDIPETYSDACFLVVPDALEALQRLAASHRRRFDIPVVGITGSNGKTIVKEWMNHLLHGAFHLVRSPRSYNSQIGVPLSVFQIDEKDDLALFEAGISQVGEMERLERIIAPTIGVMTNLGNAHQEHFSSLEQKLKEKASLFRNCRFVIYIKDDSLIDACLRDMLPPEALLDVSLSDPSAALYVSSVTKEDGQSRVCCSWHQEPLQTLTLPLLEDALLQDAFLCLALCLYLGLSWNQVKEGLSTLEPLSGRLELSDGIQGCQIVNDSYNLDLASLDTALDFLSRRSRNHHLKSAVVLSDILQSGVEPSTLYAQVSALLKNRGVERLVGVGPDLLAMEALFPMEHVFYKDTDELLLAFRQGKLGFRNEMVLVKGARLFHLEKLSELLCKKVHETTLEVNLSALASNLDYYRSMLSQGTKMVCMVKASAYGSGAVEVSRTLQDKGVEYLAVAVADEGAELRNNGIRTHILVMNPELSAFKTIFEYHLEPEVYGFALLDALHDAALKEGITHYPVHVKLDTGMHRLGFLPREVPQLIAWFKNQDALSPVSVFSHFVGSDSSRFDDFTKEQIAIFGNASGQIVSAFDHKIMRHICNSAGIERCSGTHFDMVRLGLGLYGIDPVDNRPLHTVSSLVSTILQIHDVPACETVGYSRKGVLKRDSRIAAVPIGYADGLNRHLGCGHCYCLVNGQKAPYVGNICMDVCMIDVTDIDCKEGDRVEIFGEHLPVTVLSDVLDTIPYEVLAGISNRVKRVYYQE